ncbi:MAG TPA: TIGR01459 family HAD-type hydrolase [Rhizomicrobium sp.]|nr:TIGR01459 family HAD-type hydrolase [Rhizomicrobium sp.]
MANFPVIVSGLGAIAPGHDALICDVWGVLHDGVRVHQDAVAALLQFRRRFGPVVLLSNAPRTIDALKEQFAKLGVPDDCYDAVVTSGIAARADLATRARESQLAMFHLGPERDSGIYEGLAIDLVSPERAKIVLCTGLFDDDTETPEDYRELLLSFSRRGLTFLCANPDIVVQRGGALIYCAGALAKVYAEMGGNVVYYGKPHPPIYKLVLEAAHAHAKGAIRRPLAVGDGLETDIRGARNVGLDALFIADGIHGEEVGDMSARSLAQLFARTGLWPQASMRSLVW